MKLFEIFGTFKLDDGDVEKKLKGIDSEAKKTSKTLQDVGQKVTNAGEKIKSFGSKIGSVGSSMNTKLTVPIVAAITTSIATTQDYRKEMSKLDTAFEVNGRSAKEARESYSQLFQVVGDEGVAVEASQQLAALTDDQKELSEWTNILAGVYGRFGDSLPIEGLAEAANETAKTGSLTGGLTDALNWAGESEEAFQIQLDSMNNEHERSQFILETMNGLYSEAGEKYKENSASLMEQREAQLRLTEATATFAETILPIVTEFINRLAGLIEKFNSLDKSTQDFIIKAGMIVIAIGPILTVLASVVNGIGAIVSVGGTLITSWGAISSGAVALVGGLSSTIGFLFSPAGLIILGIMAVIAAGVLLWKNWDKIKEFASNLKDSLVGKWTAIKDKTAEVFANIKDAMTKPLRTASLAIEKIVNKILGFFKFPEIKFPDIKLPKIFGGGTKNQKKNKISDIRAQGKHISMGLKNKTKEESLDIAQDTSKRLFARGGFMSSTTEFARSKQTSFVGGEAGSEGIVPLEGKHMKPMAIAISEFLKANAKQAASNTTTNINVASLVVREEADIRRIAEELERLTMRKNRLRGAY